MKRNHTSKLKDSICSNCGCEDRRFILNVWYQNRHQRLCTSCVLFSCKEYYCPTCFGVHDLITKGKLITCKICNSKSHPDCFSSIASPSTAPSMCSSCKDPKRLIFYPKELNFKGYKGIDIKAVQLLLTAAKVGCMLMSRALEEKQDYAGVQVVEAVMEHQKGKLGVKRAMADADLKNIDPNVDSLLDFSDSEDDTCVETLTDNGRVQRLAVEGEGGRLPVEFDLNEECPHH